MLPIVLNPQQLAIGLAGAGEGLDRRRMTLAGAGVMPVAIAPDAAEEDLRGLAVLFVAGLSEGAARKLAGRARLHGALVNVEDMPALCDFHMPAVVRRGELLVTVSTGGKAPGLAKLIREWLERRLGGDWKEHLSEIARARAAWREAGREPDEVSRRIRARAAEGNWLP